MSKKCRAYSYWQGESVGRYGTIQREAFYAGWEAAQASEGELLKVMEECRFALEPYDDVKPRNWETDRARLRYAHQSASKAIAAHKARCLPKIDSTGVCVDAAQLDEAVLDMKKMMGIAAPQEPTK